MAIDFFRYSVIFFMLMFVFETSCLYGYDAGSDYGARFKVYGAGMEWGMFGCLSPCWGCLASWGTFRQRVHVAVVHCSVQASEEHGMKERGRERERREGVGRARARENTPHTVSKLTTLKTVLPHGNVPSDPLISHIL